MNAEGRVKLTSQKKKNRMSKLKNSFWKWEQKYVLLKFFSCSSISQNVTFWFCFESIVQAPKTKVSLDQPSKAWKHRQTQNEKTHFSTCSWSLLSKFSLLSLEITSEWPAKRRQVVALTLLQKKVTRLAGCKVFFTQEVRGRS